MGVINKRIKMKLCFYEKFPEELIFDDNKCFYCQDKIDKGEEKTIVPILIHKYIKENQYGEIKLDNEDPVFIKNISLPYCKKHQGKPPQGSNFRFYSQLTGLFVGAIIALFLNNVNITKDGHPLTIWLLILCALISSQLIAFIVRKIIINQVSKSYPDCLDHPSFSPGYDGKWGFFIKNCQNQYADHTTKYIHYEIPIEVSNIGSATAFAETFADWVQISTQPGIYEVWTDKINNQKFDPEHAEKLSQIKQQKEKDKIQRAISRDRKKKRQLQINAALLSAEKWWEERLNSDEEPCDDPNHEYICDSCNGLIEKREGTGLVGSWMLCKNCMDRRIKDKEYFVEQAYVPINNYY